MEWKAWSLPWFAGIPELFGGAFLILGLYTRPVAIVLSGLMAFTYWTAHAPQSAFPSRDVHPDGSLRCGGTNSAMHSGS